MDKPIIYYKKPILTHFSIDLCYFLFWHHAISLEVSMGQCSFYNFQADQSDLAFVWGIQ